MSIEQALTAANITQSLKPQLAGLDPAIQGAVLAELLAIWIAGHAPDLRDDMLSMHVRAVDELVPICEMEMFGEAGHPDRRRS